MNSNYILQYINENGLPKIFELLDTEYLGIYQYERIKLEFIAGNSRGIDLQDLIDRLLVYVQNDFFEGELKIGRPSRHQNFVGRQNELSEIHKLLETLSKVAIVKGFGGVGKTTLANEYLHRYMSEYKGYIWIQNPTPDEQSTIHWEELFTNHFELLAALGLSEFRLQHQGNPDINKVLYQEIINGLKREKGKYLLIFDDVNTSIDRHLSELNLGNAWKVLCTSRQTFNRCKNYNLGFLPIKDLYQIFTHIYQIEEKEEQINDILVTLGQHTLTIELLAHIANFRGWSLDTIQSKLKTENFELLRWKNLKDVPHFDQHNLSFENIKDYLLKIYRLDNPSPEELHLLKQFCLLPSIPTIYEMLAFLFCKNNQNEEEFETLQDTLHTLKQKGYILFDDKEQEYYLHNLVVLKM